MPYNKKKCIICGCKHEGLGFCRKHYRSLKKHESPFYSPRKSTKGYRYTDAICNCNGCGKKHKAKGFCSTHYINFKNTGSPYGSAVKRSQNCIIQFLDLIESIPLNKNGCKIWPMGINSQGYGNYSISNQTYSVHRLLFTTIHNRSYYGLVVRHKCDNRSCCNIDHLEIGTQSDNIMDASNRGRLRIGENNNQSVLTESQVSYIRASYPAKSTWELSKELNIAPDNIGKAIRGVTWKHIPNSKNVITSNSAKGIKHHKAKLSDEDVRKIRLAYPEKNGVELAKEYGVRHGTIYGILNRRIWRHI